jgi:aminoglycoside phosphotransferase (APT) family kinase protein
MGSVRVIDLNQLPPTADALTPAWLTAALQESGVLNPAAQVAACRIQSFGAGGGLMAALSRLELDYHNATATAPRTMVAKFPSTAPENRAVAETYNMYGREVLFYQSLANQLPLPKPSCYVALRAPTGSDFVLLLEDLGHRRSGDQAQGSDLVEAEIVVDAMAEFHAASFGRRHDPRFAWITPHANEAQITGMEGGFAFGWPRFRETLEDLIPPPVRTWGERVGPATRNILERVCSGPQVITHGDFRLENIFFAAQPDDPPFAIIDWQSITWSSPGHDLAYYLTQSVQLPVRRAHERSLLERYLERLREHGVTDYTYTRLFHDYRLAALYLLDFAVVIAATLDLSNARGAAIARALSERCCAALDDLNCVDLLQDLP